MPKKVWVDTMTVKKLVRFHLFQLFCKLWATSDRILTQEAYVPCPIFCRWHYQIWGIFQTNWSELAGSKYQIASFCYIITYKNIPKQKFFDSGHFQSISRSWLRPFFNQSCPKHFENRPIFKFYSFYANTAKKEAKIMLKPPKNS